MKKFGAPVLIILVFAIFLFSLFMGLKDVDNAVVMDKIPVEVQVIDSREPTNGYSFDGSARYWSFNRRFDNQLQTHYHYRILYQGTLKSNEVVEFWEWVEYEEYMVALDYLGE